MLVGKTTLLRHLLENTKLKIGCIVNDVATVNIDAKLIRNDRSRDRDQNNNTTSDLADTIELANGCACKSVEHDRDHRSMLQYNRPHDGSICRLQHCRRAVQLV